MQITCNSGESNSVSSALQDYCNNMILSPPASNCAVSACLCLSTSAPFNKLFFQVYYVLATNSYPPVITDYLDIIRSKVGADTT
jgi:hypothetical protein